VNIPKPGPGQVLMIADGRATIISREEFERMRLGDGGGCIPAQPVASKTAENVEEAIALGLDVLRKDGDDGE
jgi:hypothetical protein